VTLTRSHGASGGFWLSLVKDALIVVVVALVISFLLKTFLIRSFFIPTDSMEPTLLQDDRIVVSQLHGNFLDLKRGDVIVFSDPGGWLSPLSGARENDPVSRTLDSIGNFFGISSSTSAEYLVKRIIGLPGDNLLCCDEEGFVRINEAPIDEPYLILPDGLNKVSSNDFQVTVPSGALWVMGDNRYNSADSRRNMDKVGGGFVPLENVVGRAVVVVWPQDRWSLLSNYPGVFDDIPERFDFR